MHPFPTLEKSRNRTLVEGENCGENDDGVLLQTVACEDGNCTKGEQHSHVDLDCNGNLIEEMIVNNDKIRVVGLA